MTAKKTGVFISSCVILFFFSIAFSPVIRADDQNEHRDGNAPVHTQTVQHPPAHTQPVQHAPQPQPQRPAPTNNSTPARHVDQGSGQPVRHVDQSNQNVHRTDQGSGQPVRHADQGSGQQQPVRRTGQDNSRPVRHVDQGSGQPARHVDQGSGQQQPVRRTGQDNNSNLHRVDQGQGQNVRRTDQDHRFGDANKTPRPDGGAKYSRPDGKNFEVNRNGTLTHYSKPGVDARFRDNGRLSNAHFVRPDNSQLTIHRTFYGARHIEVVRPDHSRLVAFGPHYGYVQRPLIGRPGYISRTYVWGGRPYVHVYRPYMYGRVVYYRYVPAYYYQPRFYGWAFSPWRVPIVFSWGWGGDPWYGYYGGYFAPAPYYPSASLWLTDYLLAENLRLAYENRRQADALAEAQADQSAQVTLTPAVKQQIADEVRMQIEEEQAAAAQTAPTAYSQDAPPPALDPKHRVFVVSMDLDVIADGQECSLTPGDIIVRGGDMVDGTRVPVSVVSSKPGDCGVKSTTTIQVSDLQEMHNRFREQIDSGLQTLSEKQGKNGLPAAPAAMARPVPEGVAEPDPTVENQLNQQQQEANRAESEIEQSAQQN